MSVNFNEITKPLAAGLGMAGTAATALLADPTFLSSVPVWVKPILVFLVGAAAFATVFYTPQSATPAQIQKAGSDAAKVIATAVVAPVATAATAAVQSAVIEAARPLPPPVREAVQGLSDNAGDIVARILAAVPR